MELDAAPVSPNHPSAIAANKQSPTPSEPDIERRQEDMNLASSPAPGENGQTGEGQAEDMVDLDGDMEDMDDSDGGADGDGDEGEHDLGEDFIDEDSDEA